MRFVARRLFHGFLLALGVSVLAFLFSEMAPGDYFEQMRLDPQVTPETVAALRSQYGLDRPLPVRYFRWLRSVWSGDWGYSFASNLPVAPLLRARALNTLLLTGTATLLAWLLAVPLGVWSAASRPRWAGSAVTLGLAVLLAIPDLLLGLALLFLAVRTGWFPVGGMVSVDFAELSVQGQFFDLVSHMALPVLALVLGILPVLVRHVQTAIADVIDEPYVQAAQALGFSRTRVLFRHALPAAANPLISLLGFSVASLLSGSLLIEVILRWPGLGPLLLEAILARDVYVVIGATLASTIFLVVGNLLADILLYASDPRIRTG